MNQRKRNLLKLIPPFIGLVIVFFITIERNSEISSSAITPKNLMILPSFMANEIYSLKKIMSEDLVAQKNSPYLVVHFFASWCPPCKAEMVHFLKWVRDNPNVLVLMVARKDNLNGTMRMLDSAYADVNLTEHQEELSRRLFVISDPLGQISDQFYSIALPETFIFNHNKELLARLNGRQDWTEPLENLLNHLK